jgi:hypothetical protein
MEYLIVSSVALLIGSCLAALVLRPPARLRHPTSTGSGSRPGAEVATVAPPSWRGLSGAPSPARRPAPVSPGADVAPPAVFIRHEPVPMECRGDAATEGRQVKT